MDAAAYDVVSRLDDALLAGDKALGVLLEGLHGRAELRFSLGVLLAEETDALDDVRGSVHDALHVLELLLLHPGAADEAEEGKQGLFGGDEDVLFERLLEDVGALLLGQLVCTVVRDEHNCVIQGVSADDVFLVLLGGQLVNVLQHRVEVALGGFLVLACSIDQLKRKEG